MTAKELSVVLNQAIDSGHGNAEVLFDSEAQNFCVHMVHIDSACLHADKDSGIPYPFISLHYKWKGQVE